MRKKIIIFVICLGGGFSVAIAIVTGQILRYSTINLEKKADAIIVLGAAGYAGQPSPVFRARLDHAYYLYKEKYADFIITTGGKQIGDEFSEGVVGKNYLVKKGVSDSAIFAEGESQTTKQNLDRARGIAKTEGFGSFILVSDPWHMYRAKTIAEDMELEVVTSPTGSSPIEQNPWLVAQYIARETALSILHILFDV